MDEQEPGVPVLEMETGCELLQRSVGDFTTRTEETDAEMLASVDGAFAGVKLLGESRPLVAEVIILRQFTGDCIG
jgi:hypothetical protein